MLSKLETIALTVFFALGVGMDAQAKGDVQLIEISTRSQRTDGAAPHEYDLTIYIAATGMSLVTVMTPGLPMVAQPVDSDGPDAFLAEWNGFPSLCSIDSGTSPAGFGNFVFTFHDTNGGTDSVTVNYNPGCTDPVPGHADVTQPGHLGCGMSPPIFEWGCTGACGPDGWRVEFEIAGASGIGALLPSSATTSWDPGLGGLPQGTHRFHISSRLELQSALHLTVNADPFTYDEVFESGNSVDFTFNPVSAGQSPRPGSPPNPNAFLPGPSAPVIGKTWSPVIDHAGFASNAVADFMIVSGGPTNIDLGFIGRLLCDPTQQPFFLQGNGGPPGDPFQVPVPYDCNLVGYAICTQGGSVLPNATTPLTNALDITIGTL